MISIKNLYKIFGDRTLFQETLSKFSGSDEVDFAVKAIQAYVRRVHDLAVEHVSSSRRKWRYQVAEINLELY